MASTTTAQFQANLTTARTTYANAVTTLINALIDLEALTLTVNNITGNVTHDGTFGGAKGHWPDLWTALEHPVAAPWRTHPSLRNINIDRDVTAALKSYLAQWSGS